jgi:hypothetical protein
MIVDSGGVEILLLVEPNSKIGATFKRILKNKDFITKPIDLRGQKNKLLASKETPIDYLLF